MGRPFIMVAVMCPLLIAGSSHAQSGKQYNLPDELSTAKILRGCMRSPGTTGYEQSWCFGQVTQLYLLTSADGLSDDQKFLSTTEEKRGGRCRRNCSLR